VIFIGVGHSADITKVKISPDHRHVISVSSDGAIFRWVFPVAIGKKLAAPLAGTNVEFADLSLQPQARGELVEVN
jgi:WD40 repeat protein